jgi:tetratricopeptide (TPR) repeat protein
MTEAAVAAWVRTRALIDAGRYAEAAETARAGLAADPDHAGLTLLRAIALCEVRELDEALACADRAMALQPDHALAHRTRGWILHRLGRHAEALDQLGRALALDPHDAETHVMRAEVLLARTPRSLLARRRRNQLVAEAHWHAGEATRLAPNAPGGFLVHGKARIRANDAAGAEQWARHALSIQPDHPLGHQILGMSAQLRGDSRGAADHYVAAGKLDPRSGTSLNLLRGLRTAAPISGIALYVIARAVLTLGSAAGGVLLALALVVLVCLGAWWFLGPRWRARRAMSDEARAVLARDRQVRGRFLRRR